MISLFVRVMNAAGLTSMQIVAIRVSLSAICMIIYLLLTLAGLVLVTGALSSGKMVPEAEIMFGIGSGLGYSLYSIFGKFLTPKYSAETITAYTFISASCCAVPFSGIIPELRLLGSLPVVSSSLALAVVCTVLPFILYTKGLQGMEAGKASILATAEPFMAAITGMLFFHEKMTLSKLSGMVLILAAIMIMNSAKTSTETPCP